MSRSAPKIIVVFRNDDLSALSQVDMERSIFSVFADWRIPQTLAVVPYMSRVDIHDPSGRGEAALDTNPAMASFLREAVERWGCEIALHGFTHRTHPASLRGPKDYYEFFHRSATEQEAMMQAGLDIFQGVLGLRPRTFVPPWNRLDAGTVAVCEKLGFRTISAAEHLSVPTSLVPFGVNTIPASFFADYAQAKLNETRTYLHLMYHSRSIKSAIERELLHRIVRTVAADPDCHVMTIDQAARDFSQELRLLNLAGRSICQFSEIQHSVRARAHVLVRGWSRLCPENRLELLRRAAVHQYRAGCYEACLPLDQRMDTICHRLQWLGRFCALGLGLSTLWVVSRFLPSPLHLQFAALVMVLGLCCAGVLLRRHIRSADTHQEILWQAGFAAVGVAGLACHLGY